VGTAKLLCTYHGIDLIVFNIALDPAKRWQREFELPQIAKFVPVCLRTYLPDLTKQNIVAKNVTINLKDLRGLFPALASIVVKISLPARLNLEFIAAKIVLINQKKTFGFQVFNPFEKTCLDEG
jgi:hypothetical protein